jgi:xeroderma pigmentosum group C-complementing protein
MLAKDDFKNAAKTLKGSRDTGAQLYCALLRGAGLDVRLVCSLQPLSFQAGGPSMPRSFVSPSKKSSAEGAYMTENPAIISNKAHVSSSGEIGTNVTGMYSNPRRRLGHPNAADYALPQFNVSPKAPAKPKKKPIVESPFPVFWVEILDEAHQMWLPIDPLVTDSIAKPRVFEPPMSDRENSMSYVIAFEDSGSARDVTKRYTKAFNAKTRKTRIESTPKGEKWWKRTIKSYDRGWKSDLDQIEDIELSKAEAREPMPKNIIDFKDHPIYALERHLKRNEVLVATQESGKVAAGRDSKLPGGKKMESVYRRRDVKIARSGDAWYRLGRDIKLGEQPVKTVPAKRRPDEMDVVEEFDDRPGTNLYTEDQTELYKAPPIVNGRVPRNAFGNIDIYVPSMVPKGGIHVPRKSYRPCRRTLTDFYRRRIRSCRSPSRYRLCRSTHGV